MYTENYVTITPSNMCAVETFNWE